MIDPYLSLKYFSSLLLCVLLVFAGCMTKQGEADKAAQELAEKEHGVTGQGPRQPGVPISADTLSRFLSVPQGYALRAKPTMEDLELAGAHYSHVLVMYASGEKSITCSIWDYNYIVGLTGSYTPARNADIETDEEISHPDSVGTFPAWTHWNKKFHEGTLGVVVNERVYVILDAKRGATMDDLKATADHMDLKAIAAIAQ